MRDFEGAKAHEAGPVCLSSARSFNAFGIDRFNGAFCLPLCFSFFAERFLDCLDEFCLVLMNEFVPWVRFF